MGLSAEKSSKDEENFHLLSSCGLCMRGRVQLLPRTGEQTHAGLCRSVMAAGWVWTLKAD